MAAFTFTPTDQRLLELLRSSLHQTAPSAQTFSSLTESDWQDLYRQAAHQGVMAIAWDAVERLPKECLPPRTIKLMWALEVQRYEERYARYVRTVDHLSAFYASHGIAMAQLKGVGLSSYYPVPWHREGGDIDIFTYSADPSVLSHAEANRLADQLMADKGAKVDLRTSKKHSEFSFEGIPIENHKMFINTDRFAVAERMDVVLQRLFNPVTVDLACGPAAPEEHHSFLVPSPAFNQLFIPFHAAQHYGAGLSLHQMFDWACVLQHHGLELPPEAQAEPTFMRAVNGLCYICHTYLGVDFKGLQLEYDAEFGETMFRETIHPTFPREFPTQNRLGILVYKFRRFLHKGQMAEGLLGMNFWQRITESVRNHVLRPETIFG
jgi:hypothetical protein